MQDKRHDDKENERMDEDENGGIAGGCHSLLAGKDRLPLSPLEGAGAAARGIDIDSCNQVSLSDEDVPSDAAELLLDLVS
jgi:hypothetical protein